MGEYNDLQLIELAKNDNECFESMLNKYLKKYHNLAYKYSYKYNEEKIKELEFCLNEAKKECKNQLEIIKRTNIAKNLLVNLTTLKDNEGRVLVEEKCVITHDKVPANKVYEIARLLG